MNVFVMPMGRQTCRRLFVRSFHLTCRVSSATTSAKPRSFKENPAAGIEKIRNIGIMAHIDAGKTTTTERMLFYSGLIKHIGDIDDGDTTMDYMEQERNRGITIVSAAITYAWNKHKINLIDTPGHVDFTYEVERALRVLDGAVAIIDASAGVEAQTLTVWKQADKYAIPRIAYHNKMDKPSANFVSSVNSMRDKLGATPLIIQLPIGCGKSFSGVVDLVTMEKVLWDSNSSSGGKYSRVGLCAAQDGELYTEAMRYRETLLEQLADGDEAFAETVINSSDTLDISARDIHVVLRKATLTQQGVPTLCGSSVKNKGVQPLMDAIVRYLPHPGQIQHDFLKYYKSDDLCALAFKIVHDKHRGALTFVRIYSGALKAGDQVYNATQAVTEKSARILQIYADEHKEIPSATCGNIVALSGLKTSKTGDTLVGSSTAAKTAKVLQEELGHFNPDEDENEADEGDDLVLASVAPPDPVFFCAVEPPSLSEQRALEMALACLEREDPSLRVRTDEDTAQTILEGMGELHLDIIKDRIKKEYGVDAYLGPLQIAYKETITSVGSATHTLKQVIGHKQHVISMGVSVHPWPGGGVQKHMAFDPDDPEENFNLILKRQVLKAMSRGIESALSRGPLLRSPMVDVEVRLNTFTKPRRVPEAMIAACTSACVQLALSEAETVLLEPTMIVQIDTDERNLGSILSDLSNRRSDILQVDADGVNRSVRALTPLSELVGYSTHVRTMTSGMATICMELAQYKMMSAQEQEKTIQKMTTFGGF